MDAIAITLTALIPCIIVFLVALFFFWKMRDDQRDFQVRLIQAEDRKQTLPLKIKAYERLIIMLERITPTALVMRMNTGGMPSMQWQFELLKAVREEYEHNISMQMYVSPQAWEVVKKAREEVVEMIKQSAQKAGDQGAMELNRHLFDLEARSQNKTIRFALEVLRIEAQRLMD
jgi:hypothetical protein